jgi:hypothetical protein
MHAEPQSEVKFSDLECISKPALDKYTLVKGLLCIFCQPDISENMNQI